MGDGSVYHSELHHNDEVKLAVVDRDFAEAFAECLSMIFPSHSSFSASLRRDDACPRYVVRVGSGLLADFLSQPLEKLNDAIRPHSAAFLRGLFDAEGSAVVGKSNGRLSIRVELTNNELTILQYVQHLLHEFEIDSQIGQYDRHPVVTRFIRGKRASFATPTFWLAIRKQRSLCKFQDAVSFGISRKRRKLDIALDLIHRFGTRAAANEWLRIYTKHGPRWVERENTQKPRRGLVVQLVNTPPSH